MTRWRISTATGSLAADGGEDAGKQGLKAECLEYIKEVWTDMRPLSLRKKMEEDAARNKN